MWGVEARDVGRGHIIKDLSIMPQRIDFILGVMGSQKKKKKVNKLYHNSRGQQTVYI